MDEATAFHAGQRLIVDSMEFIGRGSRCPPSVKREKLRELDEKSA